MDFYAILVWLVFGALVVGIVVATCIALFWGQE